MACTVCAVSSGMGLLRYPMRYLMMLSLGPCGQWRHLCANGNVSLMRNRAFHGSANDEPLSVLQDRTELLLPAL